MANRAILLTVEGSTVPHINKVVTVAISADLQGVAGIRLEERDRYGTVVDQQVPFQINESNDGRWILTFLLAGYTKPQVKRHYRLCLDANALSKQLPPQLQVNEVYYQGQMAYRIQTPSATVIFHQYCGGIASLIDADDNDWIGYNPHGGSDGKYRGIPNIKHPDDYFHPGASNATSELTAIGSLCCQLHTKTNDGVCEAIWEVYPHHMTFHLLKAPDLYWLLYEGTPGGKLDEKDGFVTWSDGTRFPLSNRWETVLDPGWLYFGAVHVERVLFLTQHETEAKLSSYFPMGGDMTVFGFGRKDLKHYLTNAPVRYSFGFVDTHDHQQIATHIESIRHDVRVNVEPSMQGL